MAQVLLLDLTSSPIINSYLKKVIEEVTILKNTELKINNDIELHINNSNINNQTTSNNNHNITNSPSKSKHIELIKLKRQGERIQTQISDIRKRLLNTNGYVMCEYGYSVGFIKDLPFANTQWNNLIWFFYNELTIDCLNVKMELNNRIDKISQHKHFIPLVINNYYVQYNNLLNRKSFILQSNDGLIQIHNRIHYTMQTINLNNLTEDEESSNIDECNIQKELNDALILQNIKYSNFTEFNCITDILIQILYQDNNTISQSSSNIKRRLCDNPTATKTTELNQSINDNNKRIKITIGE